MTFLNPFILIGLAAAAIPLIIHLFNFRRPRKVDFSSLVFLKELERSTMQRVRIKQWLLLALRTLAIALLVLAFARPTVDAVFPGNLAGRGKTSSVIIVDNSQSMTYRDNAGAYMEQARTIGAALLDRMESGDDVSIVPTVRAPGMGTRLVSPTAARESLLRIETSSGRMNLTEEIRTAIALLGQSANPNREIHVISDLQKSTLTDSVQASADSSIPIDVIPVGTLKRPNLAVTGIRILSRIITAGRPVRMEVGLTEFGDQTRSNVQVSVFLESERVAQTTVSVPANDEVRVAISVTPREFGWIRGRIEIDDDDYLPDNARSFSLYVPESRKILLIRGVGVDTEFLELAMKSIPQDSQARFDVRVVDESAMSIEVLGRYDAVIISGVEDLSTGERRLLAQYVSDGGGLLVFPGDRMVIADYNALLDALNAGRFTEITQPMGEVNTLGGFSMADLEHPLFEGMFEKSRVDGRVSLEQPDIHRIAVYTPGIANEQTLIRLSGDQPFLQEIRSGRGHVLLFAVSTEPTWSDFATRGLFVPLLFRSIYYVSSGGSISGPEYITGEPAEIRLPGVSLNDTITLRNESGDSYLPDVRSIPGAVLASIEAGVLRVGISDILQGESLIRLVSVYPFPPESNLVSAAPGEAVELLKESTGNSVALIDLSGVGPERLGERLKVAQTGTELWNVFLMLALFTLILEMIVEKQWRPEG